MLLLHKVEWSSVKALCFTHNKGQKLLYKHGRLILCVTKRCKWDSSVNGRNNRVGKENVCKVRCSADYEKVPVMPSWEVIRFSFQENEQGDWWLSLIRALWKALIGAAAGRCRRGPFIQGDPKISVRPCLEESSHQPMHLVLKLPFPIPQTPS